MKYIRDVNDHLARILGSDILGNRIVSSYVRNINYLDFNEYHANCSDKDIILLLLAWYAIVKS